MLSCKEVLARHSEYMDGELEPAELVRWQAHLAECVLCARYDRVLRHGLRLLSKQPESDVDPSFKLHLRYRLAHEERRTAMRPVTIGAAASVSIAAMLALAAWLPLMMAARGETEIPVGATAAEHAELTASEIAWHGGAAVRDGHLPARTAVRLQHTSPGVSLLEPRYTPLILEPPTAPPSYTRVSFTSLESR